MMMIMIKKILNLVVVGRKKGEELIHCLLPVFLL